MKNIKHILVFTLIALSIISCKQNTKSTIANDDQIIVSENELKALSHSLEMTEGEYNTLLSENEKIISKNKLYHRKIHLLQSEVDSLNSTTNNLKRQLYAFQSIPAPELSNHEQELVSMVHRMHADWKKLPQEKEIDAVLQYFLPQFMVSQVAIDKANKGHLANYTREEYIKHLKAITNQKGYAYEFGNVHFLDIEIKEGEFFNVAYKCTMRRYKGDQRVNTNSILITMTGKKMDDGWKIAHYSLVNFQYQAFQNITL